MESLEQEWINGEITLGAAAQWSSDEIRIVSELGFALAQQGRNNEAIAVFEGLSAIAPATNYFDSALGALWLRQRVFDRAIEHLNSALKADPTDIPNRVNRAEALIHGGQIKRALEDLEIAFKTEPVSPADTESLTRADALRASILAQESN